MAPEARGIGLIESLLAMLALSLALTALLHLQALLRDSAEHDRQRLDALALAQSLHESLRQGDPAPADLPVGDGLTLQTQDLSAELSADLSADLPPLRQRHSVVRWTARRDWPAVLELATLLPTDPNEADRLAAAVLLQRAPSRRDDNGKLRPTPRHPLIPDGATPLGDGRSIWQPRADVPTVWLIDDDSGEVLALCGGLTIRPDGLRQAKDCVAIGGLLISGTVRFSTERQDPGPAEAESPLSPALPLAVVIRAATPGGVAPRSDCVADGPVALPAPDVMHPPGLVRYRCVVAGTASGPGSPPRWSGRVDLVPLGWTIGTAESLPPALPVRRVCRYSADHDHNGRIDNPEHPAVHVGVDGPLGNQNFLVVRGSAACPRDAPAGLPMSLGLFWLDDSTQPHQPP